VRLFLDTSVLLAAHGVGRNPFRVVIFWPVIPGWLVPRDSGL
jgi:hypothetical protein